jgi:hypothetical protein
MSQLEQIVENSDSATHGIFEAFLGMPHKCKNCLAAVDAVNKETGWCQECNEEQEELK